MKGSKAILVLATLVLLLGASELRAQDDYMISLTNTITPGTTTIRFNRYVYSFEANNYYVVGFAEIDGTHIAVRFKPLLKVRPCEIVIVQWNSFAEQTLDLGTSGGDTFIFNSETGYAEK